MAFMPNVGKTDRIIRVIIAIVLFVLSIFVISWIRIAFIVVAIILLITTITQFCGLYKILGINTCKIKS